MQSTSTKYCDTNAHSFPKENDDDEEGSRSSSNNSREICAERLMSILENQQELTPKLADSAATTTTNNGANNRDTGTNTTLPWSASALPTSVRERYNRRVEFRTSEEQTHFEIKSIGSGELINENENIFVFVFDRVCPSATRM